ncbi:MAG TPA: biotin--[acetyl-CoA-carboxylase] ligase [Cytophagaceae bacterium]
MYNNLSNTLFIGKSLIYLPTCHSTNDELASLVDSATPEGLTVITSDQTAGKGQRGNTWESAPYKNLTFSVLLKPHFLPVRQQFDLNLVASLAVFDVLTNLTEKKVKIKWPNDIICDNKKICGILIQNVLKKDLIAHSIVGVGLNVNQESFSYSTATSLQQVTGEQHSLEDILISLLEKLEARYLQLKSKSSVLKKEYLENLYWIGEERLFKSEGEVFKAVIRGVDESGYLVVESQTGDRKFGIKEIQYVG